MDAAQINTVIDKLADKLAVPTEKLIEAYALGGGAIFIAAGITLIVTLVLAGFAKTICTAVDSYENGWFILMIFNLLIAAFSFLALTLTLPDFILWLKSPEAYALTKIVSELRVK